jgi:hypothetical protein
MTREPRERQQDAHVRAWRQAEHLRSWHEGNEAWWQEHGHPDGRPSEPIRPARRAKAPGPPATFAPAWEAHPARSHEPQRTKAHTTARWSEPKRNKRWQARPSRVPVPQVSDDLQAQIDAYHGRSRRVVAHDDLERVIRNTVNSVRPTAGGTLS